VCTCVFACVCVGGGGWEEIGSILGCALRLLHPWLGTEGRMLDRAVYSVRPDCGNQRCELAEASALSQCHEDCPLVAAACPQSASGACSGHGVCVGGTRCEVRTVPDAVRPVGACVPCTLCTCSRVPPGLTCAPPPPPLPGPPVPPFCTPPHALFSALLDTRGRPAPTVRPTGWPPPRSAFACSFRAPFCSATTGSGAGWRRVWTAGARTVASAVGLGAGTLYETIVVMMMMMMMMMMVMMMVKMRMERGWEGGGGRSRSRSRPGVFVACCCVSTLQLVARWRPCVGRCTPCSA
jgi:hypothetical protein